MVIVAALVSFAKFPMHRATGTSLAALLLPVAILGVMQYWKAGHVDVRAAGLLAGGLLVGAWAGARLALQVSGPMLQRAFAVFLVLMAIRLWLKAGT